MLKFLYFITCTITIFAQDVSEKQKIQKEIDTTSIFSEKVQLFVDLAWEYTITENDSALFYAEKAIQISKNNNYILGEAIALEAKGLFEEIVTGNYDKASVYYFNGIALCEAHNLIYATSIYHSVGVMFHTSDNYGKALEYYEIAYKRAIKEKNFVIQKKCLINMGAIESSLKNYTKAEKLLLESLDLKVRKDYDYSTYANLGNLKIRKKKFKEAIPYLEKATEVHPNNPDAEEHIMYLLNAKASLKDSSNLKSILQRANAFVEKSNSNRTKSLMLTAISNYHRSFGEFEKALIYNDKYLTIYEEIKEKQRDQTVYDLETKYQTEKIQRDLEKKQAAQKLLYLSLAATGILLFFVSFFLYKNRKKNLLLANQKKILEKTIGEKNILLRETHHRVKNSFQMVSSLLYLQSENVEDKEAKRAIKEAQNRVRSMVLIHHKLYNKKQLVGIDTKEYIEDLTKDIFESHQSETINLNYQLEVASIILSVDTITPIGLILNELIINVLKHAFNENTEEGLLQITFFKKGEYLILKVIDNGKGFIENDKGYSFGLKLIRALARKLEASFKINSDIEKGTQAILTITDFEIVT